MLSLNETFSILSISILSLAGLAVKDFPVNFGNIRVSSIQYRAFAISLDG
jgi:hypothetical protein